ncbi:unnamed protein product [Meloidogyne enterolobii]|uniref:Uncharacterized protein n=1 Tax=Meloidogyne enterolobii TaxID=390850 RepID=A0ACB1AHF9_MELEN
MEMVKELHNLLKSNFLLLVPDGVLLASGRITSPKYSYYPYLEGRTIKIFEFNFL